MYEVINAKKIIAAGCVLVVVVVGLHFFNG